MADRGSFYIQYAHSWVKTVADAMESEYAMDNFDFSNQIDISLRGDNLEAWRKHIATLKESEWLLSFALLANNAAVLATIPLRLSARVMGFPLQLLGIITMGAIHYLFQIVLAPFWALVLWTSGLWSSAPFARPFLLVVGPASAALTLILVSLFPEQPDVRDSKILLCELWPLSQRRLAWIREHSRSGLAGTLR